MRPRPRSRPRNIRGSAVGVRSMSSYWTWGPRPTATSSAVNVSGRTRAVSSRWLGPDDYGGCMPWGSRAVCSVSIRHENCTTWGSRTSRPRSRRMSPMSGMRRNDYGRAGSAGSAGARMGPGTGPSTFVNYMRRPSSLSRNDQWRTIVSGTGMGTGTVSVGRVSRVISRRARTVTSHDNLR